MFLLTFSALVSLGGLTIMSSIREEIDEWPLKKKESKDIGTLRCGICGTQVRLSKYQTHWVRCFLRKEKNSAKVKGRNN